MAACDSFRTEEVIKAISQDEYSDLDEISDKGSTSSEHGDFDQSDSSGSEQSEDTLTQPCGICPAGRRKNTSSADVLTGNFMRISIRLNLYGFWNTID